MAECRTTGRRVSTRPTPSTFPALLAVMTTAVLWGTTGTAATLSDGVGPLATGAAALGIGGILQALIALPEGVFEDG